MTVTISASIGIAFAPDDAADGASLLWCADIAMYRAKLGGVPFETYQVDIDQIGNRVLLLDELRTAIAEHQLVLYYQPQVDLRTGEIVAVESLIRWVHPALGVIPPLEFLPFAEEAGLMDAITTLVLTDAIAQCARWRSDGNFRTVAVNISATSLIDPLFTETVAGLLAASMFRPRRLSWKSPRPPSSPTSHDPSGSSRISPTLASPCRLTTSARASPRWPTCAASP